MRLVLISVLVAYLNLKNVVVQQFKKNISPLLTYK